MSIGLCRRQPCICIKCRSPVNWNSRTVVIVAANISYLVPLAFLMPLHVCTEKRALCFIINQIINNWDELLRDGGFIWKCSRPESWNISLVPGHKIQKILY
jgi:hypothetical protein